MIQIEDVEATVRHHLGDPIEPNDTDESLQSAAHHFKSEVLSTDVPHSASEINIKVADFGAGRWEADKSTPRHWIQRLTVGDVQSLLDG